MQSYFEQDAVVLAKDLLGKMIRMNGCSVMITETEAYKEDLASHGIKPRGRLMRETYGHWYVYLIYGMHHCVNITTNKSGAGAVLIRSVQPINGKKIMLQRRPKGDFDGPSKVCQGLGITKELDGMPIKEIHDYKTFQNIKATPRIGITKDKDLLWRFTLNDRGLDTA